MDHNWIDPEMIYTLLIARLPPPQRSAAVAALTALINATTDPNMDTGRVDIAVRAAVNAINGTPDAKWRASNRLRELVAAGY